MNEPKSNVSYIRGSGGALRLREADLDAQIASQREVADAINCGEIADAPGCTPEQQQAARAVCDWLAERPLLCAVVAVAVIVLTVLASERRPWGWW